jgi:hypothetical protein
MAVLRTDVHVSLPDHSVVVLKKGTRVPKDLEEYVTNPKAYAPEGSEGSGSESGSDESHGYSDLKGDDLRDLLKQRELPQTGNNKEMVARLTADDAERETGSEGSGSESGSDESQED